MRCDECVFCRECSAIAFCESDTAAPPCAHGERLCEDCLTSCEACLVEMEPTC